MGYSLEQFEQEIQQIRPRPFDTYVLPGFLIFYAVKSRSGMGRLARRMLFTAGVYMVYRNYAEYKKAYYEMLARLNAGGGNA